MLVTLVIILSITTIVSAYFAIRFGITILNFQDAIEESLEVIDEKYKSISEICERPLFFDSPEVRRVLQDVKATRDSLITVALSLTRDFSPEEVENDEG